MKPLRLALLVLPLPFGVRPAAKGNALTNR